MCKSCGRELTARNRSGFCHRCQAARYRLDPAYRERQKERCRENQRTRYRNDPEYRERHKARMRAAQRVKWRQVAADPKLRRAHNARQRAWTHKRMADPEYAERRRRYFRRWDRQRRGVPVEDRFCTNCGARIRPGNRSGYCRKQDCRNAWQRLRRRTDPVWREHDRARQRERRARYGTQIARYKRLWRRRRQIEGFCRTVRRIIESNPVIAAQVARTAIQRDMP